MKRTFVASLFLLVLSLISNTASALTSTCGFLYAPPLGQTTAAHRADWNLYSYPYDDWIDMYTYITAPNGAGGALQSYRANTLGSQIHYWINVVDGNYTVYGDNYEYYYGQTSGCSWSGTRNTTPPPTVSVVATPSATVVVGTPIRITWSSTNATSCTYNGGQTIPITSGTSTNGYYEWTPNAAGSNTYTITCTGAGGTGSANVTTTYTPQCIINGNVISAIAPYSGGDPYPLNTGGLTSGTQGALACFTSAVQGVGGSITVTSAYRPQGYQDHLVEVWNKWQLLQNNNDQACATVKGNVSAENSLHGMVAQPATTSNHTSGLSFDAAVALPGGYNVDTLAASCNLSRPNPSGDPVHYTYSP